MAVIEVYADVWCPFAHAGLRTVARRRHEFGRDDVVLRVRAWPLELVNGVPLDRESTSQHVDELCTQVAPDLFAGFEPDHFPPTSLPALELAAAAYRQGERIGEAVSFALRDALFEEGHDISSLEILRHLARGHRVQDAADEDRAAVRTDWLSGQARGVKGSPHFFCGVLDVFCPSLDIARDDEGHLHLGRDIKRLDAFLRDCTRV